jgi:hypothetical protein
VSKPTKDEIAASLTGIPAATLAGLRDGTLVAVPKRLLDAFVGELNASDGYAKQEQRGPLPTVWQIKNDLLRETLNAMLATAQKEPQP